MRRFLIAFCLLLIPVFAWASLNILGVSNVVKVQGVDNVAKVGGVTTSAGGGCGAQSWNTFSDFRLDFDQATAFDACLTSGTETGGSVNSPTVVTPPTASPVSGGNCLYANNGNDYIQFDNTGPYFQSQYGEVMFSFRQDQDNAGEDTILRISHAFQEDWLLFSINEFGALFVTWEDNNDGAVTITVPVIDIDSHRDEWIQCHIKWDTTACTDGNGNCEDGGADNELGVRCRVDDNDDGDFDDGGLEDWPAWTYDGDTDDLQAWASEPGENDIFIGFIGTHSTDYWVDDLEISYSKPASMDN